MMISDCGEEERSFFDYHSSAMYTMAIHGMSQESCLHSFIWHFSSIMFFKINTLCMLY